MPSPRIIHIDGHEYRVETPLKHAEHSGHYQHVFSGTLDRCQMFAGARGWPTAVHGAPAPAAPAAPSSKPDVTAAALKLAKEKGIDPFSAVPDPRSGKIGVPQVHAAAKAQGK